MIILASPRKNHTVGMASRISSRRPGEGMDKCGRLGILASRAEIEIRSAPATFRREIGGSSFAPFPFATRTAKVVSWYGSSTDIEDRKRAEESYAKTSASFRRLRIGYLRPLLSRIRRHSALRRTTAVLDYTGLTIEDVTTSDFRARIFHPEDIERLREERQAALSRGVPFESNNER